VTGFNATFKAILWGNTCCGALPADGFSFNLVPAGTDPNSVTAEEGANSGLAVCFDTWDNGGGEAPAIDVKWLGTTVGHVPFQPSQSPLGVPDAISASRNVVINLDSDGTIDVSYGGSNIFNNLATGYTPGTIGVPNWIFAARTGGANDNNWIDDLQIIQGAAGITTTIDG
jgi:hypothetical protein